MDSGQIISDTIIILITFIMAYFFVAAEFALVESRLSALEEAKETAVGDGSKRLIEQSTWFRI
ncbi:hypothetical protein GCM10019815_05800 [Pediococcus damnosus]